MILITIIVTYLIGSFSSAYLLGKVFRNIDIRGFGSGNSGTTNAIRVMGGKIGILTFVLDLLKGIIAVLVGRFILGYNGGLIGAFFAVIGHNWPIFIGFRGGKGVATSLGALLMYSPLGTIISVFVALVIFLRTKYVSLGSMVFLSLVPIISSIIEKEFNKQFFILSLLLAIMAIIRHKDNIDRLLSGTENKFGRW